MCACASPVSLASGFKLFTLVIYVRIVFAHAPKMVLGVKPILYKISFRASSFFCTAAATCQAKGDATNAFFSSRFFLRKCYVKESFFLFKGF